MKTSKPPKKNFHFSCQIDEQNMKLNRPIRKLIHRITIGEKKRVSYS